MEHYKILNYLKIQLYRNVWQKYKFETSILRSYLCGYSDAYVVVKKTIDLLAAVSNEYYKAEKDALFKTNAQMYHAFPKLTLHWYTMQKILI